MCFIIFWNQKTCFQTMKTRSLKSRKIEIFPKGLVHGFGKKRAIFFFFFVGNIGQENVFYNILEQKNVFPDYENIKFKKVKKLRFFQRG